MKRNQVTITAIVALLTLSLISCEQGQKERSQQNSKASKDAQIKLDTLSNNIARLIGGKPIVAIPPQNWIPLL